VSSQQELGQHYLVEIISRADTVRNRCDALLSKDFASDAPKALAVTLRRISEYLAAAAEAVFKQIDWSASEREVAQDFRVLQVTDQVVQDLAEQLRYIEGARTDRLPWSIVPAFESLVKRVLPDVQIMLRAMWHYNYAFHLQDQRAYFLRLLTEYVDYLPGIDIEQTVLKDLPRPFHIISFPSLERKHILLHSLLGHELGHLLVDRYLDEAKESAFIAKIKREVEQHTDRQIGEIPDSYGPLLKQAVRDQFQSQNMRTALELWRRALEELLSDLAGACLFGPATLFSTLEMAIQGGYDVQPDETTQYYPPWRMRLRYVFRILREQGGWFPVPAHVFADDGERKARVDRRVSLIEGLIADERDMKELQKNKLAAIAYREAEDEVSRGLEFLLSTCDLNAIRPDSQALYKAMPALIERLDNAIPPNAFEESLADRRIASFGEILNAAWFHRISQVPFHGELSPLDAAVIRNRLNNLTLKAIEYSELARQYADHTSKVSKGDAPS
jgi:hypothetical protein